jgi:hypothetical protein
LLLAAGPACAALPALPALAPALTRASSRHPRLLRTGFSRRPSLLSSFRFLTTLVHAPPASPSPGDVGDAVVPGLAASRSSLDSRKKLGVLDILRAEPCLPPRQAPRPSLYGR